MSSTTSASSGFSLLAGKASTATLATAASERMDSVGSTNEIQKTVSKSSDSYTSEGTVEQNPGTLSPIWSGFVTKSNSIDISHGKRPLTKANLAKFNDQSSERGAGASSPSTEVQSEVRLRVESSVQSGPPGAPGLGGVDAVLASKPTELTTNIRGQAQYPSHGTGFVPASAFAESIMTGRNPSSRRYVRVGLELPSNFVPTSVQQLPAGDQHSDDKSCILDSVNATVGYQLLSRENTGTLPTENLNLGDGLTRSLIATAGIQLVSVFRHRKRKKNNTQKPIPLWKLLREPRGLFLVEFLFHNDAARDWHMITVNCTDRWIFCNQMGYLPFSMALMHESAATHAALVDLFAIKQVDRIYIVCQQPGIALVPPQGRRAGNGARKIKT